MMMAIGKISTTLVVASLCLGFTLGNSASNKQNCNCRGPTNYYKELGCTPVFKNPDDCCPIRYDCSVLNNLTKDQCLISGHVYQNNENIKDEDANRCDWCTCRREGDYTASFVCAIPSCAMPQIPNESCRYIMTDDCCGVRVICPKEDGSFANCTIDGKTFSDGEAFVPSTEPHKRCRCAEGYTGENVEPFCISPKHTWCSNVIYSQNEIRTCAPAYDFGASLQTDCNDNFRCPSGTDVVINRTNEDGANESEDPDMLCKFGNLTMRIGDQLNRDMSTVQCICEVPPVLTCRRSESYVKPEPWMHG